MLLLNLILHRAGWGHKVSLSASYDLYKLDAFSVKLSLCCDFFFKIKWHQSSVWKWDIKFGKWDQFTVRTFDTKFWLIVFDPPAIPSIFNCIINQFSLLGKFTFRTIRWKITQQYWCLDEIYRSPYHQRSSLQAFWNCRTNNFPTPTRCVLCRRLCWKMRETEREKKKPYLRREYYLERN